MSSAKRWVDREYVGRPGLSPVVAGLVASGVLSPGLDLLDLGCGRGTDAVPLAALGLRVTGVDVNPRSLAHARQAAKRAKVKVDLRRADVTKGLPFEARSFDIVMDTLLLNNLEDEELEPYAREVARVLRRRGTLVVQEKTSRRPAAWHPARILPELEARFEFGLPVHTHLAEGRGREKGHIPVIVLVGRRR